MPGLVWWGMMRSVGRWNAGWWRFASCDEAGGRLKELGFVERDEL